MNVRRRVTITATQMPLVRIQMGALDVCAMWDSLEMASTAQVRMWHGIIGGRGGYMVSVLRDDLSCKLFIRIYMYKSN